MFYGSPISAIALLAGLCAPVADARVWDDTKYPDFSGQWSPVGGPGAI